jgi:hypothetical protein
MSPVKIGPSTVNLDLDNIVDSRSRTRRNKPDYYEPELTPEADHTPEQDVREYVTKEELYYPEERDWLKDRLEVAAWTSKGDTKKFAKLWGTSHRLCSDVICADCCRRWPRPQGFELVGQ